MNKPLRNQEEEGTEQIRLCIDRRIAAHFERQAYDLGIKLTTMLQLVIGEKYLEQKRSQKK